MIPTYATEAQALLYYPSAQGQPAIVVTSVLRDAHDVVESVARAPHQTSTLLEALTPASTRLRVTRSQSLPPKGYVQVGDERIAYASKTEKSEETYLDGITRGALNTQAQAHPVDSPLFGATEDYADRRRRAELRAFAYYMETQGFVRSESLSRVASTSYSSNANLRRILKSIMGRRTSSSAPIVGQPGQEPRSRRRRY